MQPSTLSIAAHINAVKLAGSTRLSLACNLKSFPVEIYDLADTLEILDLSGNDLSSLPDDFSRLHKLRILFCSSNQFTRLPEVLGQCPQLSMVGFKSNKIRSVPAASLGKSLRWLILTDNQIIELPAELGLCTKLQKLMLSCNQLQSLPEALTACTQLELLRIAANRFSSLPEWLFRLPRLSWLAYAGNPYSEASEQYALTQNPVGHVHWQQLEVQQKLGEGASGVIHQANWQCAARFESAVAVKLFKGAQTSDGLPQHEMAACISAGLHPNLIQVYGKIIDHPLDISGLVMALIPSHFSNLAGPPSLDSCTRDIYHDESKFTLDNALRIAHGIASAALHLHHHGIMHGDLYAHNILHNGQGNCLLGDFGAASFVPYKNKERARAFQRLEVRAFGCLLEELIERCQITTKAEAILKHLRLLQLSCMQENSESRPLFTEIVQTLSALRRLVVDSAV